MVIIYIFSEGNTLFITKLDENLDYVIKMILNKSFFRKGRKLYLPLGGNNVFCYIFSPILNLKLFILNHSNSFQNLEKQVEINEKFKLYLITSLPKPHFLPEIQSQASVIDFTVTIKGIIHSWIYINIYIYISIFY